MNSQLKILIIDDDINIVASIGKTFTTMAKGFLVLTATSANEGLAMIREQRPDVVVLDVRLGPDSGMDLLKDYDAHYKELHNRPYRPRFIVITAYRDENIKKEALEVYHVDAFLLKPFEVSQIRKVVMTSVQDLLVSFHNELCPYTGRPSIKKDGPPEKK